MLDGVNNASRDQEMQRARLKPLAPTKPLVA